MYVLCYSFCLILVLIFAAKEKAEYNFILKALETSLEKLAHDSPYDVKQRQDMHSELFFFLIFIHYDCSSGLNTISFLMLNIYMVFEKDCTFLKKKKYIISVPWWQIIIFFEKALSFFGHPVSWFISDVMDSDAAFINADTTCKMHLHAFSLCFVIEQNIVMPICDRLGNN